MDMNQNSIINTFLKYLKVLIIIIRVSNLVLLIKKKPLGLCLEMMVILAFKWREQIIPMYMAHVH